MKLPLCLTVLAIALISVNGIHSPPPVPYSPPQVQVYSRNPGMLGKDNKLICHVKSFYPPEISVQLLEDGEKMPKTNQTNLDFEQSWHFYLTSSVHFTPMEGKRYSCRVKHLDSPSKDYYWESDM